MTTVIVGGATNALVGIVVYLTDGIYTFFWQAVDLLNNLDNLAEDQTQAIDKLQNNVRNFNADALMKATQQYGTGKTKRTLKSIVRNVLQHA
jgi:hypothetical protein